MSPASARPPARSGAKKSASADGSARDWKSLFQRTIFLVLGISLAVHVLVLLAFGSVAIFKGSVPKLPFVSQEIEAEAVADTPPPPAEEEPAPMEETTADPFAQEVPESSAAEESAPALDMLTVVGGANWAPAIPKNVPVSETGVIGGTGKGTGLGLGGGGGAGSGGGKQLFGIQIKARKLGVVVSINQGAQSAGRLPAIFEEIFKQFPDTIIFLTNGGGMQDWDVAYGQFKKEKAEKEKRMQAGEQVDFFVKDMPKPEVLRFNQKNSSEWVTVRGNSRARDYPGLQKKYPDLYEVLLKRPNVWFVSSHKKAGGAYLAFEDLLKKDVEAIYWYNQFDEPIEGKAADAVADEILESKVEVLVEGSGGKGMAWLQKVGAKFVK